MPVFQEEPPTLTARQVLDLVPNPYLHVDEERIYNPFTDRALTPSDALFPALRKVMGDRSALSQLVFSELTELSRGLFLVDATVDLSRRFYLRYVSLEAHTVCNQACYFCPVSFAPRAPYFMPTPLFERIAQELSSFRDTIEGVAMINYNEPTADHRFLDQIRTLKEAGLPPAVLTNGSGLTPKRVDAIIEMGGLRYLSINISTLDRARYAKDRGVDQLETVLRNLDYARDKRLSREMDIVVLGKGDDFHRQDHEEITRYFEGSLFRVRPFEVMDRAGYLPLGLRPENPHATLRGCENLGSRPLQHIHITPHGKCVLCCEDYDEKYIAGDLTVQSVREVLEGEPLAILRKWIYGQEKAPDDFICRKCIFARAR